MQAVVLARARCRLQDILAQVVVHACVGSNVESRPAGNPSPEVYVMVQPESPAERIAYADSADVFLVGFVGHAAGSKSR